ncbi:putative mitochondrial protein, partial [Tanacetum coccineum]
MSKKVAEVDDDLAQFKADVTDNQKDNKQFAEETRQRLDVMKEAIDRNRADSDKQFAEVKLPLKALQPPTTAAVPPLQPVVFPRKNHRTQSLMNRVFCPYMRKFVLVFSNDILVYNMSLEEHLEHLRLVFEKLWREGLYCNRKKCAFGHTQVEYLGHIVSKEGVMADSTKVTTMLTWPIPKNIRELRGFLGLTGYYRKFVQGFGKIAKPLTDLLRKDSFVWSDEATRAFKRLQQVMTQVHVLALPDFSKEFMMETNASGYEVGVGAGAVLMQEGRPIAYFSQVLGTRAQLKSVYKGELMAIVIA